MTKKTNRAHNKSQKIAACVFDLGNGKYSATLKRGQKFRSLIVDVNEERSVALGLCPTLIMLPWSFAPLEVDTFNIVSGREATAILLEEAAKKGIKANAAEFCFNYEGFGVDKGTAFLPTRLELAQVASHQKTIEDMLTVIGYNKCNYTFWSSSVCNDDATVWMMSMSSYSISGYKQQSQTFGVMPMIEIEL